MKWISIIGDNRHVIESRVFKIDTKHRGRTARITASYTAERDFTSRLGERLHKVVCGIL